MVTGASGRPRERAARGSDWGGAAAPPINPSSVAHANIRPIMPPKVMQSGDPRLKPLPDAALTDLPPPPAVVAHEATARRHYHPQQRARVYHRRVGGDLIARQQKGDQAVGLIRGEGARRVQRHRAIDVVVQGGRVWPVVPDRADETRVAPEREALSRLPPDEAVERTLGPRRAGAATG